MSRSFRSAGNRVKSPRRTHVRVQSWVATVVPNGYPDRSPRGPGVSARIDSDLDLGQVPPRPATRERAARSACWDGPRGELCLSRARASRAGAGRALPRSARAPGYLSPAHERGRRPRSPGHRVPRAPPLPRLRNPGAWLCARALLPVRQGRAGRRVRFATPHRGVAIRASPGPGLTSCKGRGFCPSCCGRRMADTAVHLCDEVLPEVPIRQWVLSFPFRVR